MNRILFHLLNLDPATGVSLQIVRRVRAGFWAIIGWGLLSFRRSKKQVEEVMDAEDFS